MAATGAWQRAAPVVRAEVDCQGRRHVVVWRRGSLALAHHDLLAEEALAALGGEVPPCLEVVRAWRAGLVDAAPSPHVFFQPGRRRGEPTVAHVVRRGGRPLLPEPLRRTRLLTLLLGRSRHWTETHEVGARAHAPLSQATPRGATVSVSGRGGVDAPRLGRRRGVLLLVLPTRWLTHVWARQLELHEGAFVADAGARPGADGRVRLVVVAWEGPSASLQERRVALSVSPGSGSGGPGAW